MPFSVSTFDKLIIQILGFLEVPLSPSEMPASIAWFGLICYTLQIYFDFSGYSDMAIGMGRMFGFRFLENFNHPYIAQSIGDFWRRWHISLSTWFRDYLYLPLGGSRCGKFRTAFNLFTVFLLCGFWHGATWSFIAWGAWHGVFLTIEHFGGRALIDRLWQPLRHGYALVIVLIGWVFFRADSLLGAIGYISALSGFGLGQSVSIPLTEFAGGEEWFFLALGLLFSMPLMDWVITGCEGPLVHEERWSWKASGRLIAEFVGIATLLMLAVNYLIVQTSNPFIYYRF